MMQARTENTSSRSIKVPSTGDMVPAKFLTGAEPTWTDTDRPREVLANWITAKDNPWFAKMAANRTVGIVHGARHRSASR